MLKLNCLRELPVSAASGLLFLQNQFYVVADDELSLVIFSQDSKDHGQTVQLLPGELPLEHAARKKAKPDHEALLFLPQMDAILAIPSGSKPNRVSGALVRKVQGQVQVQKIDFTQLYQHLAELIPALNIEGAAISGLNLQLFSRGNGASQKNSILILNLETVLKELGAGHSLSAKSYHNQIHCELGAISGYPFGFTDAAVEAPDRIWYLAAAEGGNSTYDDGQFLGAVLGCMNAKGQVSWQKNLQITAKPEGLALDLARQKFYVVTDADDRSMPALLLEGDMRDLRQS